MVTSGMGSERQFRVASIPGKGRGLVADTVIEAGSAIVAEEPYIACLEDDTIKKRSSYSFQASDSLSWCGGCNLVGCGPSLHLRHHRPHSAHKHQQLGETQDV